MNPTRVLDPITPDTITGTSATVVRRNAVNPSLTPKPRTGRVVENDQYAAFARRIVPVPAEPVTTPSPAAPVKDVAPAAALPNALVMSASLLAAQHQNTTGRPIDTQTLAERLGVDHTTARNVMTAAGIDTSTTAPARVNGHDPVKVHA